MVDYPKRERFFSHKFVRILQKSCATMDIGRDAALLLCFIAHTEDAAKYSGPVRFWNEQLMTTMDFKSPKQLQEARSRAIEFGWLYYERSGNRQVGRYFVCIPSDAEGLDDSIIEPNHSVNHSANGTNTGRIAERIGDGLRNEKVTESGKPSIPIPDPIPRPNPNTNSCGEPEVPASPPQPVMVFPVVGGVTTEWGLLQSKIDEYQASFPGLNALAECRAARQWCIDNETKRKTPRGMPKFLSGWLANNQNRGGGSPSNARARKPIPMLPEE